VKDIEQYFSDQVGADLPVAVAEELSALRQRLINMWVALITRLACTYILYIVKDLLGNASHGTDLGTMAEETGTTGD